MSCNLKEYKEFIDNEMLLILGQMDKATHIFDHVYLVRTAGFHLISAPVWLLYHQGRSVLIHRSVFPLQGSEWNASNLEELRECG